MFLCFFICKLMFLTSMPHNDRLSFILAVVAAAFLRTYVCKSAVKFKHSLMIENIILHNFLKPKNN